MPLLKKKQFSLAEPPKDLDPCELVYQVRFTKEIFRDYQEYLNRINLYRQRVWVCKVTGKTSLTYEEALVSEKRAGEKVQQFPKELMAPVLRIIQYSMLSLKDLAITIAEKLQKHLFVGAELYGRKENGVFACKITKVLDEDPEKIQYEVAWLDKNKKVMEHSLVSREDLIQKKVLFSRNVLKSFIRDSTYRSAPWVIHDKLAQNHGISTDLPEELRDQVFFKDGLLVCNKKRRKIEEDGKIEKEAGKNKRKKMEGDDESMKEPIKYPIDDLLVQPGADDPVFTDRPSPSRDFNVPLDCVGDLLMVWDFCSSFGRLLRLWPFSLEDFENAICHKDRNVILLVETHSALFRLLIKDNDEYLLAARKRNQNQKLKITLINWTEYLCDFLEITKLPESNYRATIKRGHYGLLDAHAKLGILKELVNLALQTDIFREKLDNLIEERQEIGATKRGEALEKARKKREEKEQLKAVADSNGVMDQQFLESVESVAENDNHSNQNGHMEKKRNGKILSSQQGNASENCEDKLANTTKKKAKKLNLDVEVQPDGGKDSSRKEGLKYLKDDKNTHTPSASSSNKNMATLHFTPSPTLFLPRHNHPTKLSATAFHHKIKPSRLSSHIVRSYKVVIEHEGQTTQLEVEPDETILAKALDSGLSVPHDCKLGVCMTCPARLLSGSVDQSDGMLSDDVVERGYALLCAAYPRSDCHIRTIPEDELLSLQLATAND